MDETRTAELLVSGESGTNESSTLEGTPETRLLLKPEPTKLSLAAGVVLVFAISSVSSEIEPRVWDREHEVTSALELYEQPYDRRISLAMARRIALEILREAEDERTRSAEEEARYGIDWVEAP